MRDTSGLDQSGGSRGREKGSDSGDILKAELSESADILRAGVSEGVGKESQG